jgi:tRNA threonylcarbamoyladenosine biosynthesis protein TsaB
VKPLILAVDTTREYGSLALSRGQETVADVLLHAPTGFAHVIYGYLEALLVRTGVAVGEIDCFAAASGPGSFTGVRVGLACIQGLAEALGKQAVAVSNLEAVASFGTADLRAPVLEARRGEVYGAVYNSAGRLVTPETVARFPLWLESLPAAGLEFVCLDWYPDLAGTRFANARVTAAPRALASAIARIAAARFERGEARDPATLDANYVRRSDAELFWKE